MVNGLPRYRLFVIKKPSTLIKSSFHIVNTSCDEAHGLDSASRLTKSPD